MKNLVFTLALMTTALSGADKSLWVPTRIPALRYPGLGVQARIGGTVILRIHLTASGTVATAQVISGVPVLAKAAQDNIRLWKFSPLCSQPNLRDGEIDFTYIFKLEGEALPTPVTDFLYEYPDKVTVTSHPQHWMP